MTAFQIAGWVFGVILGIVAIFLVVWSARGFRIVPQNDEWIVERLGKYCKTWKPGLHWLILPGIWKVRAEVYMGQQQMRLSMDKPNEGYGDGRVDLTDGSVGVLADLFFQITDSYKAVYSILDLIEAIDGKMDSAIRSFLSGKTIDEANKSKSSLNLETINEIIPLESDLAALGVAIRAVAIVDIVLDEAIMTQRGKVLEAEKTLQQAKLNMRTTIIASAGKRQAAKNEARANQAILEAQGNGFASQIGALIKQGVTPEEAGRIVNGSIKWTSIGDKALIVEGNSQAAVFGAEFAAGTEVNRSRSRREKPKPQNPSEGERQ